MLMNIKRTPRQNGFTLIEAMITVAIIALLAAVGYPLYDNQSRKGKRAEAITALSTAQNDMERCYLNTANAVYTGCAPTNLGPTPKGYYAIALTAILAQSYTLTATAQGGQVADPCGNFGINQAGVKTVSGAATVANCWLN